MSRSLPDRPDLGQLRRQAKELRDAARRGEGAALDRIAGQHRPVRPDPVGLAVAQLVIARELGFSSWPTLKAAVDADAAARHAVSAFLTASVEGRPRRAEDILRAAAGIATDSLLAATVLGDVTAVRAALDADPAAAVAIDDARGWPPLLYVCHSHWHRIDPRRIPGLADVARLLLEAGASPNTNDGGRPRFRSALKGAVEVDNPAVTEALLDAGANPDLGYPLGEAVGHGDRRCLQLLLAHGARVTQTWVIDAAAAADDPAAVSLLLNALDAGSIGATATASLPDAAADASLPVVVALLDAGADPRATADGMSAYRRAVRAGKPDTAAVLRAAGALDDDTDIDRFLGACLAGDRAAAERLVADEPGLPGRLTDADQAMIFTAAAQSPSAVDLMLGLGFSAHQRNHLGERPMHTAAYHGNAAAVRSLIDAGAVLDARDDRFDATPLAFATVGSGERAGAPGDWPAVVRMLIDAGASRQGVWISGKPPSEDVIALLRHYGIAPDEPDEQPAPDAAGSAGTGVLSEIAEHLEAAYQERDLDLLGTLLDPEARWTGLCANRAQILDWYRGLLDAGTIPVVRGVEVDRDAVVLALAVRGRAEGARPAPPRHLYQVFTVREAHIVDIRAYPDRASALARTPSRQHE